MGGQDVVALVIVGAAVWYAGRSLWRTLHGETGCAGECSSSKNAAAHQADMRLKRVPLVTLDTVDKPRPVDAPLPPRST